MPSEETLRQEAEMAARFERSDAIQKDMGIRLDVSKKRINKGRQGSSAQRGEHRQQMKSAGRYMVRKRG